MILKLVNCRLPVKGRCALQKRWSTSANGSGSIFPPDIASLRNLQKIESKYPQAHPVLFERMKSLYENIPKGEAPKKNLSNLNFVARYFEHHGTPGNESMKPVIHWFAIVVTIGYLWTNFRAGHYHPSKEFH